MQARFNTIGLDHNSFAGLDSAEKYRYNADLITGKAVIVEFVNDDSEFICSAIYTVHGDVIHVTELAGKFVKPIKKIEKFTTALARALKLKAISYTPRRMGTKRIGSLLGFEMDDYGDFVKVV